MSASLQPQTPRPEIKEFSNIRSTDGIKYMSSKSFDKHLQKMVEISSGAYGKIYASGRKYAIKKFEKDYSLTELIKELNIYASIVHPCILTPIAWTAIDGVGYLLMYKGKNVEEAFKEGKITIEEIIADSLSAIAYMNLMGYAHRDIKPGNMIYYKQKGQDRGKCMIIDMGLAIKATLGTSTEGKDPNYYIKGLAYTSVYMDPEYFYKQYNSIKVELYSLGMCYKQILTNKLPNFGDLFEFRTGLPHLDWLFNQITPPLDRRASIQQVLERAPKALITSSRRYTGIMFRETAITYNNYPNAEAFTHILMSWLIQVCRNIGVSSETAFLCLHLIHRAFEKILIKYNGKTSTIQMFGCVCMSLATIVTGDILFDAEEAKYLSSDTSATYEVEYQEMVVNVLIVLQGIVSTVTYWNYAKSVTDLKLLLLDIMKPNYNPNLIREVTSGPSKCVTFREIMSYDEHKEAEKQMNSWVIPDELNRSQVHPCDINVDADIVVLEKYTTQETDWNDVMKYRDYIAVLLHNRSVAEQLKLKNSRIVFESLDYSSKLIGTYTLDALCLCNWRKWADKILASKSIHPFKVTDEELSMSKSKRNTSITQELSESNLDIGLPPLVPKRGPGRPRKIIPTEDKVSVIPPSRTKSKPNIQIEESIPVVTVPTQIVTKEKLPQRTKSLQVEESAPVVTVPPVMEEKPPRWKRPSSKSIQVEESAPVVIVTIPEKPTPYQEYLAKRENPTQGNSSPITPYRRKKPLSPVSVVKNPNIDSSSDS